MGPDLVVPTAMHLILIINACKQIKSKCERQSEMWLYNHREKLPVTLLLFISSIKQKHVRHGSDATGQNSYLE